MSSPTRSRNARVSADLPLPASPMTRTTLPRPVRASERTVRDSEASSSSRSSSVGKLPDRSRAPVRLAAAMPVPVLDSATASGPGATPSSWSRSRSISPYRRSAAVRSPVSTASRSSSTCACLIGRVETQQLGPAAGAPQQQLVPRPQPPSGLLRPGLVEVVGEQFARGTARAPPAYASAEPVPALSAASAAASKAATSTSSAAAGKQRDDLVPDDHGVARIELPGERSARPCAGAGARHRSRRPATARRVTRSRCSRARGASASSFTSAEAWRRCHRSCGSTTPSMRTANPPSSATSTRTAGSYCRSTGRFPGRRDHRAGRFAEGRGKTVLLASPQSPTR